MLAAPRTARPSPGHTGQEGEWLSLLGDAVGVGVGDWAEAGRARTQSSARVSMARTHMGSGFAVGGGGSCQSGVGRRGRGGALWYTAVVRWMLLLMVLLAGPCSAETVRLKLGITDVPVVVEAFQGPFAEEVVVVALHDDENAGVEAARLVLAERGGTLVELRHTGKRYLGFQTEAGGRWYRVDPNRMFTDNGRRIDEGLESFGRAPAAREAVRRFAAEVLELLLEHAVIVAVHNNRGLTLDDVAIRPSLADWMPDPPESTEFLLVTEAWLFDALAATRWDVGLVDRERLVKYRDRMSPVHGLLMNDGSLSVFCSLVGRVPYVNVEAYNDAGMVAVQRQMLEALFDALEATRDRWGRPAPEEPTRI